MRRISRSASKATPAEQGNCEDLDRIGRQRLARAARRQDRRCRARLANATHRLRLGRAPRCRHSWGDVSTAYFTTGIPNIEVFTAISQKGLDGMRRVNWIAPLLRQRWMQAVAKRIVDARSRPTAPSATTIRACLGRGAQRRRIQDCAPAHGERLLADGCFLARYPGHAAGAATDVGLRDTQRAGRRRLRRTLPGSSPIRIDS